MRAHCTCMAGLGEACSHIAALLFTVEANTRVKKRTVCTSLPCSWLPPTFRSVPYAQLSDIDSQHLSRKGRRMTSTVLPVAGNALKQPVCLPLRHHQKNFFLFTQISLRPGSLCYSLFCQSFVSHTYLCV